MWEKNLHIPMRGVAQVSDLPRKVRAFVSSTFLEIWKVEDAVLHSEDRKYRKMHILTDNEDCTIVIVAADTWGLSPVEGSSQ